VPSRRRAPRAARCSPTAANTAIVKSWRSSKWRKYVGVGEIIFLGFDGWARRFPTYASLWPSRLTAHDSGSMRIATPSSCRTFTDYSLPVSRRTAKQTVRHHCARKPGGVGLSNRRVTWQGLVCCSAISRIYRASERVTWGAGLGALCTASHCFAVIQPWRNQIPIWQ